MVFYEKGDLNGDSVITQADSQLLAGYLENPYSGYTTEFIKAADVNGDGTITQADAAALLEKIA